MLGVAVEKSAERLGGDPLLGQSVVSELWECDMWHQPFPSRRSLYVAVVGLAVLAGGCGVDPVGAEPLPTPTPSCTPDGSSAPCTWERAAEQAEAAAAFAEAEHAYREFMKATAKALREGGRQSATPEMARYGSDPILDYYGNVVADGMENGLTITSEVVVSNVTLLTYSTDELHMLACEDGTGNEVLGSDGEVIVSGTKGSVEVVATQVDSVWRVSDSWPTDEEMCS